MITCCEIALASILANVISLAIFRNYYLKVKRMTLELKKKNGKEQEQIEDLKKSLLAFGKDNDELRKEVEKLKARGEKN